MTATTRSIELEVIKGDAIFYRNLLNQLISSERSDILIFGLIPYLSLFTIETYRYLQKTIPTYADSLTIKHAGIIGSSRMRVKLFDDSKKRLDGMFELLNWITEFHIEWHIKKHKGIIGLLKRAIQKDMGIFAFQGHIIGSTHSGFF